MNIQNAIGKRLEQTRPDKPHEAGKAHEADILAAQRLHDRLVVVIAARVVPRVQEDRRNPGLLGAKQPTRIGPVRHHDRNRRVERACTNRIDDGLQVGPATRNQDRQSPVHDSLV